MTGAALSALWGHWRRHPGQALTLVLGLALATALWSGVQAINAEARASYDRAAAALGQNDLDTLAAPDGRLFDQSAYVDLRRAGWLVSPVLEGRLRVGERSVTLRGLDPLTAPLAANPVDLSDPDDLAPFLRGEVGYLHPETLATLDPTLLPLRVAPALRLPLGVLIVDIGAAQRLLDQPGRVSHLLVWPDQPRGLPALDAVAPDLVRRAPQARADVASLTDSFHLNLTAFGFLAFAVGLFIVHSAIGLAFEQRRTTFRTLRALGLPAGRLVGLLAAEVTLLALLAGGIGLGLGALVAALLLPDVAATLRGLYGAEVTGALTLRPAWALAGLGLALAGAFAAAAQGLWRVLRLPVLAPAQPRAWLRASDRGLVVQAWVAALLLILAGIIALTASGLIAAFVLLACLLLGAALALPPLLSGLLALAARRSRSVLGQWVLADTRQQVPGLGLALMALMLALAANIGVGTMVSSFRLTFTGWLDQRLASEFYVTGRTQDEADAIRVLLAPQAMAVLPIWRAAQPLAGAPGEVYAVADHPTYRDNWPLLRADPQVWDRVADGTGLLINEQLWRRSGLELGDNLDLPGWSAPVVGVYSDYGNPKGQVMLSPDRFTALYPDAPRLGMAVRIAPEAIPALRAAISDRFGLPDALMIDQAAVKRFSLGVFERTFAVSGALNVLTLGVAGFALLTSFLTLAAMRLPQLAPVWALGLTRARLARIELARAAILAALTALYALPVGLAMAWTLLAVVNVEAFGWRLPMFLFPGQWAVLGALALGAALLAAVWPVRRLARTPPADLLKVFAHDR